ncbi:MAG: hypothetical protein ACFFD4_02425 [Candidatus Odinarchaeota archaeon]
MTVNDTFWTFAEVFAETMKERGSFNGKTDFNGMLSDYRSAFYKMKQRGFTKEQLLEITGYWILRVQITLVYHPDFNPEKDLAA